VSSISTTPTLASASDLAERPRDIAFDYLKATVVLMVVAHHSCLAYTTFAHFDAAHYLTSSAPVVDTARWRFFDYAENFNDVFFMSLMFFISGLFVWPSLRRSGSLAFLRARLLRLGAPFAAGVLLLMPLAYYASWQLTGHDAGYLAYWHRTFTQALPPGPLWFIWLLLLFDVFAVGFFVAWPRRISAVPLAWTKRKPIIVSAMMLVICVVVYLPALKAFGPHAWGEFFIPPLYFRLSRFGLYLAWFAAGAWLGHDDLEHGLLAQDGALARHWPWWAAACFVAYNVLWFLPMGLAAAGALTAPQRGAIWAFLWVVSCVASCFAFLAIFRGVVRARRAWMDSFSRSAYIIYIVHYVYVLWLQRALMGVNVHAGLKFLIVFTGATLFSWLTAQCLLGFPWLRKVL
jgi:glucan biosynthesis protein C